MLNAWRERSSNILVRDHKTLTGLQLEESLLEVALVH